MIQIDMEMPETCDDCPMPDETYNACPFFELRGGEDWTSNFMRPKTCPLREVIRCGKCRHYLGNHDVPGCAPCDFWDLAGVMWDDYCKRGERWDG